ncbi:hypothetical protein O3M35_001877 [Rhynocoris fuscipes]|uniref:Uncharacterized protein n=1 Tax=Rhynocoris fuscipes TaxID=488301 RepID=A0AAW1CWK4_9HEMI
MRMIDSDRCRCDERKTPEYIIFECQLYDDMRVTLWRKIGFNINLNHASLTTHSWGSNRLFYK